MFVFEDLLCRTFEEVNVNALLEENLQNQESRSAGVKLNLDDDFENFHEETGN